VGAALFPGVLAALTGHHPDIRLVLVEHGEADWERRFSAGAPVVAVLPAQDGPIGPGRRESTLWREPMRVVVPEEHPLAAGGAVPLEWLARHPLIVAGTESARASDAMGLLHAAGIEALPRARVDTPQSLVAMARAGVGVGLAGAVALAHLNIDGLAVLDIAKPGLMRDVAAYWYEVLVRTELGRALLDAVLDAPLPPGAMPAARAPRRAVPAARK